MKHSEETQGCIFWTITAPMIGLFFVIPGAEAAQTMHLVDKKKVQCYNKPMR